MIIQEIKEIKSSRKNLREFGFTIGAAFLIIALFLFWKGNLLSLYFFLPALIFFLTGFFAPKILLPLHKAWMTLAVILGFFSTRVILILLYYLVITPIGIFGKIAGKKFLDEEISPSAESYWIYREKKEFDKNSVEKQF